MACPGRSSALARFPVWSGGGDCLLAETDKAGASSESGEGGGLLQLDTPTRELNARLETEGQLGQKRKERSTKTRDLTGTEQSGWWLSSSSSVFLQAGLELCCMGNAPRAAHKTTSGFLVPCRIDDTNGAKDRLILFIKSSLLAEAWSVVISTRDGQLRQDSGGVENSSSSP